MSEHEERCVRILAPLGRDAELVRATLQSRGLRVEVHPDASALCEATRRGAGAILLTQEAFGLPDFHRVIGMLRRQPPWSDLPLVVLVARGTPGATVGEALRKLDAHANATLLERPVQPSTILRAVESALRTRNRQYDLREQLSARVRAEEAERRVRIEAEEALRIRDEFLAVASHELRNPVAAINGAAQLLQRARAGKWLTDEKLDTYLEMLEMTGRHLAELTDDLLDASRLQRGELPFHPEPTDLAALVWDVVRTGEWVEHRVHLEAEPALDLVIDPNRVRQVVLNLLDNAIKYSPESQSVQVRLRRDQGGVLLEVEDAGIGLPRNSLESIFRPFGRAENAERTNIPGLGLGLYLSQRIAEQHGGRLSASSEGEGRGTTMSLWLPLESASP